jgi:hypothetical protein
MFKENCNVIDRQDILMKFLSLKQENNSEKTTKHSDPIKES